MVGARDDEVRLREPKSGSQGETNREETKRMPKEAMDRWNKAGLGKLGIQNWEERVHNREEWKKVSVAANTLEEL